MFEVWGFQGGEDNDDHDDVLGCEIVQFRRYMMFWRNILSPSSKPKYDTTRFLETLACTYETTRHQTQNTVNITISFLASLRNIWNYNKVVNKLKK
jgi:hypothetical protein